MLATALGTTLVACGSDSKTITTKDGKVTVNGDGKDAKVTGSTAVMSVIVSNET
jgi:hypothetical protein